VTGTPISVGPTGTRVAQAVDAHRRANGLAYTTLSDLLAQHGRPIPPLGLRRIRDGERRVDVDDLVALAAVLHTTVGNLLDGGPVTFTP
jgi:hypothetical protein